MATEEQKNNQQTLNDLLNDYKSGQIEAAEYTAVMTSRTADLSDALRQTVKLKKTSSELDKQLLGSVKRISDLARTLESPYKKISDVQKDIVKSQKEQIKLDNTLAALKNKLGATIDKNGISQLKKAEDYIALQEKVITNEEDFERARASASAQEKIYADELVANERALQSEVKKRSELLKAVNQDEFNANKELLEEKKKSEKDAINEISQLRQKQLEASQSLETATKAKTELEESGADKTQIEEAEAKRLKAQQNYDLSKEATLNKELQIKEITRNITSFAEESFTSKEKELLTSFETTKNLEKEKKATKEIIESNKSIDQTLVNQIAQKGVILDTSIDELATAEEKLSTDAKIYAQGIATSKINKTNAEYLETQKEYLRDIQKRQAAYNLTLGFAEGLLKKLGANNAAIALGLEEGKKAAEEMAKAIEEGKETSGIFGGQLKILGAGIKGTFKGMADGLKNLSIATLLGVGIGKAVGLLLTPVKKAIKGAFDAIMFPAKKIFGEIQGYFSSFVGYISSSFFSIQGLVDTFNKGDQLSKQLSQATEDIATGLGVSTQEAENLTDQVRQFSGELGAFPEVLAQNMVALNQAFGTTQKFSDETARSFNRMVERLGFSTEEAAEFVKIAKITGETENDILGGIEDQTMALKNQYGVAISQKSVFQDISKASSATRLSLGNNTKELTNAAFQAKRLGLEMNQVASMGSNLLEFESSIANEMEAELLIGRDLNLERARAAFLNNDIATAAEEIAGQIGSAADFSKMNVIQQEALAKAVGTNREGLADMLETQEMLANTGFKDMSEAQQEFNKLVESGMNIEQAQAKFRERYGNEALATQAAQVSYAKQREMQERALIASASKIAEALMPVARALRNFQERIEEIRVVMIDQMRPFFKELGSFVGDAGDQFAIILESYIKPLGKRLNDIGLTLIGFARKNGPEFKKTFESILDVFGSIYGLVGDIIKELFNVKGTSSVADPLKNSLQLVQNIAKDIVSYVKSIDAGGIAEKIQSVITGIGNFYQGLYNFVKGTITTIKGAIDYVKENPITSIVGTGAALGLAKLLKRGSSRLFPMFTKNVDGPGGGMFKRLKNLFSKPKSGTGLTGTSRIINAIKGGFKGGGFKGAVRGAGTAASRMIGSSGAGQLVGKIGSGASQLAGRIGLSSLLGGGAAGAGAAGAGSAGAGAASAAGAGSLTAASLGPAIIGLAASYGLNILKKDQQAKVSSIDVDLTKDISANQVKVLEEQRETSKNNSKMLGIAAETAKYAGIGATIGSIIPGIGTALGAGVGAIVGGAIGTYNEYGDDISDWGSALGLWSERASKAADDFNESFRKTQQKLARTQAKIAKNLQKAEATRNLAIKKATRDVVGQFKDLAAAGKINFETVKSTDKGFQDFTRQMYLAGNLTEEEFQNAINGVVTPMNTLKSATEGASDRLNEAFNKIEGKIRGETKEKVETARFEYIAKTGIDPVKFQEDATRILEASGTISADLFKSGLDEARRVGADVQASELLSVLQGEGTNAGIELKEAEDIKETFIQPIIQAAKGDEKQIEAANTAFNTALSEFDRVYGNLDLEEEESSAKFVEVYQRILGQTLNDVTQAFQQNEAEIEKKASQELKEAAKAQIQQEDVAKTINANFTANQDKIISALESDNKPTSKLIEDQLKKDDELYGLLDKKLTDQGTSLKNILAKGIDPSELIKLQKGLIELSKVALETGNADLSEKVINLSSNLGVQDGVIRSIQQVQDGSSISHNGPFTIQDSKGNVAITHPKDKLVVSPNVSYIADGATGKGGPVFPVSEKFGALDVKVGKEGVLVQKINDGITGNPTQYINDGLLTQDEIFESYGITTEAKTKKYTYKPPKTFSSRSGKGKGSSKPSGSSTTGMALQEILEKRALTKEEEEFRNQGLLAGTLFEPDMQLLRENKRNIYELKINPADYFDPITGTSILDKTQYEFGVNAKYGLGHTYTPNATPTYNSYLTPGYKYGIFDFEDLTTVLSKPVNVNAQGGAIGMSLGMASPTFINLQEMSAGGGIDLTQDYNTHPEMQSIMQKVLPSQASPSSAINYTAQSDATNINVPNLQFTPYYDAVTPTIGDEGLQQVNDGIGFWEVISNPMGAVKHYVLPTLIEESGHVIKSLFKTKALSTALKGILKKTPIIGHAMHAATGALNISHLLHEEGMSEDQLNQEVGTAALVALGGIGGGIIGGMLAGTLSSITGPGAIVIGTLGGIAGSMIGEIFAEFAADTLGAEPVGRPIVSMFKHEEASLPSYRPLLTENLAPKLESQFEPPQNVLDGYSYLDVIANPTEYLKNTLSEVGEIGLTKLVSGAFATPAIKEGAISLSKTATKKLPFIGPVIEALFGGYDAYNAVEKYKNDPQSPPISELYQELGTIGYETLGGIGGSLIGGLALTPALGPVGTFIGGLLGGLGGQIVGSLLADIFGAESMGRKMTNFFTSVPQQVQDGSALSSRGPFTITDKFGATAITAKGDGVVVSPNISYVNDGIVDAEPINQIATSSTQQHTTVIEQDNSELKQELESMKQLMSELIKELPTIANRPITIELDGNKVGEGLGRIGYRG